MRRVGLATALLLGAAHEGVARADDAADLEGLLDEQVVTSASKKSEGASSAPALSTNLTAEDLRRYGIRTLAEAIDFLSIGVSSSDNLDGGEIGARGVLLTGDRGSHFLLLVDGHAMNDPLRGGASFGFGSGVPIELVDHIEVIVGPGSALYGSSAMLGLINVVTRQAKDYRGVHLVAESSLFTGVRAGVGVGHTFSLLGQKGEVTAQAQYVRQDGPHFFIGAENTGVDAFTGQPGRHSPGDSATGIWGGQRATHSPRLEAPGAIVRVALGNTELHLRGASHVHAAPTGIGDFDPAGQGEHETRLSADLKHRFAVSTELEVSARLYGDYYRTSSDFYASRGVLCPFGNITCRTHSAGSARAAGLEVQGSLDWFHNGRFVTIMGVNAQGRAVESSNETENVATGRPLVPPPPGLDRSDVIVAGYLQQTWVISPAVRLNAGGRIDRDARFSPVVTPRAAVIWNAWTGGTLKLSYSEAFRAPSWYETDSSTATRIVSSGLQPEKVRSVEANLQHQVGVHRFFVGGFYSHWSRLVELESLTRPEAINAIREGLTNLPFTPGVELTQYRNSDSILNYGLNTGVSGSLGVNRFLYGLTVTPSQAVVREATGSSPLPVAPRLIANARVAVVLGDRLPTVALAAHYLGLRHASVVEDSFPTSVRAPAQLELRLALTGNVPAVPGLSYRAIATYAVSDRGPYVIGPVTKALPTQPRPQLNPVDTFRTTVGLQYDF